MGRPTQFGVVSYSRKLTSFACRYLPGLLLLVAAVLKLLEHGQPPAGELAWLADRFGLPVASLAAPVEMAIGIWMLGRASGRVKGVAATVLFSLFLAFNLHRASLGIQECNCFGVLSMPVPVTIAIDFTAIGCGLWRAGFFRILIRLGFLRNNKLTAPEGGRFATNSGDGDRSAWATGMREVAVAIGLGLILASCVKFWVLIAPMAMEQYKPEKTMQVVQSGPLSRQAVNHE